MEYKNTSNEQIELQVSYLSFVLTLRIKSDSSFSKVHYVKSALHSTSGLSDAFETITFSCYYEIDLLVIKKFSVLLIFLAYVRKYLRRFSELGSLTHTAYIRGLFF